MLNAVSRRGLGRWRTSERNEVGTGSVLTSALLLYALPVVFSIVVLSGVHGSGVLGFDFRGTLWDPGEDILVGRTPYPPPEPDALRTGNPAVYPPAVMLVTAPLTLLPWELGLTVWLVLCAAAAWGSLRLLGVRDPAIYFAVLASGPLIVGFIHGNLTLVLLLGLAAAWRWRNRPSAAGACVAALIVAKLFLWPLFVWLLVTRRFRSAAYGLAFAAVAAVGSWAIIGFDGFRSYPSLLRALDRFYTRHSLSPAAFGIELGLSDTAAKALALALGLLLLAVGGVLASRADGDRRMFTTAVLAAIVISPIVWIFYFMLLFVPLAIYRPTLSRAWWIASGFWAVVFLGATTTDEAPCCRPDGMPKLVWRTLSTRPSPVLIVGCGLLCVATALVTLRGRPVYEKAAAKPT